jgi:hypothetical protein
MDISSKIHSSAVTISFLDIRDERWGHHTPGIYNSTSHQNRDLKSSETHHHLLVRKIYLTGMLPDLITDHDEARLMFSRS